MSSTNTARTHNLAQIDITNLAAVREAVREANAIGHWRRILAIYGDHLPTCNVRLCHPATMPGCDCGWAEAFDT